MYFGGQWMRGKQMESGLFSYGHQLYCFAVIVAINIHNTPYPLFDFTSIASDMVCTLLYVAFWSCVFCSGWNINEFSKARRDGAADSPWQGNLPKLIP